MLDDRKRLFLLAAVMFSVAMLVAGLAVGILYGTALDQQRARLVEIAQSQARLMEAVARFDRRHARYYGQESAAATISQIRDARRHYKGFGKTGEFVLARRQGDEMVFVIRHRHGDLDNPKPVPFSSNIAEPMRRALSNVSGTMIGLDYRGVTVLAAYEPVSDLDLGIVAKIDLVEVRAPFVRAGMIVLAIAVVIIGVGTFVLFRIGEPIIAKVRAGEAKFRNIARSANDGIVSIDADGAVVSWNEAAEKIFGYTEREMLGLPLSRIIPVRYREKHDTAVRRFKASKTKTMVGNVVEATAVRKNGIEFPAEISISAWAVDEDQFFAGIIRDISERKQAEAAILEAKQRYENIFYGAEVSILEEDLSDVLAELRRLRADGVADLRAHLGEHPQAAWDLAGKVKVNDVNAATLELFGAPSRAVMLQSVDRMFAPDSINTFIDELCAIWDGKDQFRAEGVLQHTIDGRELSVLLSMPIPDTDEGFRSIPVSIVDMTERERAEDSLRKLSRAVEQSPASVIITDTDAVIEYVNPKFVEVTGYAADEVIGRNPSILKSGETPLETYEDMWRTIIVGGEWRGEVYNRKKNGELFWESTAISPIRAANGTVTHYLAVKEDLTDRKEYEQALHYQANYDPLTELPNRALALDRLSLAIKRVRRHSNKAALLFIDLDDFKSVNDGLGHETGDRLLQQVAQRLVGCIRTEDTVARMGGDEFTVILPDFHTFTDVENVAKKIIQAFSAPFMVDGHELYITPSIGITVCPDDGNDPHALMKNADAAMYRAKQKGRNNFQFFTQEMNDRMVRRLRIESHLRHALERCEFSVDYQPLVDIRSGTVTGVEALLRWHSPELGFMPPDEFIPLAEDSGLIDAIGEWVLGAACRQLRSWREAGLPPLRVSVNVSARQFRGTHLLGAVLHAMEESAIESGHLELEITESIILDDVSDNLAKVQALKNLGVRISVDDFGTGYSSLRYLKQFPVDALKIDKSFIRDVTTDPNDATVVKAMVNLAHSLNLEPVAEGVETREQLEFLRACGCTTVQGFYIGKPAPPEAFLEFIKTWRAGDAFPPAAPGMVPPRG